MGKRFKVTDLRGVQVERYNALVDCVGSEAALRDARKWPVEYEDGPEPEETDLQVLTRALNRAVETGAITDSEADHLENRFAFLAKEGEYADD